MSQKPSKSLKSIIEERSDIPESQRVGTSRHGASQRDGNTRTFLHEMTLAIADHPLFFWSRAARSQSGVSRSQMNPASVPPQKTGGTHDEFARASAGGGSAVMSPARSRRTLDPEATPTPSRPASPGDLNAEERRMVNDILLRPAGTRTSYAASAAAPSMLEPEVQNSHFHDSELCMLLHALDAPMEEPVKKAVRKAVRTRVKKLGMKYDNEVRINFDCFLLRMFAKVIFDD